MLSYQNPRRPERAGYPAGAPKSRHSSPRQEELFEDLSRFGIAAAFGRDALAQPFVQLLNPARYRRIVMAGERFQHPAARWRATFRVLTANLPGPMWCFLSSSLCPPIRSRSLHISRCGARWASPSASPTWLRPRSSPLSKSDVGSTVWAGAAQDAHGRECALAVRCRRDRSAEVREAHPGA